MNYREPFSGGRLSQRTLDARSRKYLDSRPTSYNRLQKPMLGNSNTGLANAVGRTFWAGYGPRLDDDHLMAGSFEPIAPIASSQLRIHFLGPSAAIAAPRFAFVRSSELKTPSGSAVHRWPIRGPKDRVSIGAVAGKATAIRWTGKSMLYVACHLAL